MATSTLDFQPPEFLCFKPPGLSYIVTVTPADSLKVPSPQVQDQRGTLIQCVPLGNSMHSQTLAHSCDLSRTQNLLGELVGKQGALVYT